MHLGVSTDDWLGIRSILFFSGPYWDRPRPNSIDSGCARCAGGVRAAPLSTPTPRREQPKPKPRARASPALFRIVCVPPTNRILNGCQRPSLIDFSFLDCTNRGVFRAFQSTFPSRTSHPDPPLDARTFEAATPFPMWREGGAPSRSASVGGPRCYTHPSAVASLLVLAFRNNPQMD